MADQGDDLFPEIQGTSPSVPAPIRNNNPGALMPNGQIATYPTMGAGRDAADKNLAGYASKGVNTLRGVINRWAPKSAGNPTDNYLAYVAKQTGIDPDAKIDLNDSSVRDKILGGMAQFESGRVLDMTAPRVPVASVPVTQNPINQAATGINPLSVAPQVVSAPVIQSNNPSTPQVSGTEAGIRGFTSGATLGLGNKIQAAIRSNVPFNFSPPDVGESPWNPLSYFHSDLPGDRETYEQYRDEGDISNQAAQQQHPLIYGGTQIVGSLPAYAALGTVAGPVGGSAIAGAIQGAGKTGKDTGDVIENTLIGGGLGAASGVVGKGINSFFNWAANKYGTAVLSKWNAEELQAAKDAYQQQLADYNQRLANYAASPKIVSANGTVISTPPTPPVMGDAENWTLDQLKNVAAKVHLNNQVNGGSMPGLNMSTADYIKYSALGNAGREAASNSIAGTIGKHAVGLGTGVLAAPLGGYLGGKAAPYLGVDPSTGEIVGAGLGDIIGTAAGYGTNSKYPVIGNMIGSAVAPVISRIGRAVIQQPTQDTVSRMASKGITIPALSTAGINKATAAAGAANAVIPGLIGRPTGIVQPSQAQGTQLGDNLFPETDTRSPLQKLIDAFSRTYSDSIRNNPGDAPFVP